MGKFAQIFLILSVCLISVKSLGYMHSEEELAKLNKEVDDIQKTFDDFSKNLSGVLPQKFKSLRNALDAYAAAHADNELDSAGTGWADAVNGAKKTQRAWLKYRDAWLAFAGLNFPIISKSSLETALTADRISRLRKIATS